MFRCKICLEEDENVMRDSQLYKAPYHDGSNLTKHLSRHPRVASWLKKHNKSINRVKECLIDQNMWTFLTYFLSSNMSITEMRKKEFQKLVSLTVKCPSYETLRNKLLDVVLKRLFDLIEIRLSVATVITLITDLWTNSMNTRFLALAVSCTHLDTSKEIFVLDMREVSESATAENIKEHIESMINQFNFDKSKIIGLI